MKRIRRWLRALRREDGQGMTEYIIIVGLIAIGTIGVVTVFGDNVRGLFGAAAGSLANESAKAETSSEVGELKRDLKSFSEN